MFALPSRNVYLVPVSLGVLAALTAFATLAAQGCAAGSGSRADGETNTQVTATTAAGSAPTDGSPSSSTPPATSAPANSGGSGGSGGMDDGPGAAGPSPIERHGALRVDGAQLAGSSGEPVTLRGMGFGWDNWWPQYYNADVVDWLADDWCADMVRPAMGIEPDGAYLSNPDASRARIQAVVEAAIAKGVYVIIDWHAHELHQAEAVAFFSDMAQAYGEHPNVIYEIFNEPDMETWPEVKAYAETVGAAIREHDPDNLIIVGSPEWDQRIDLVAADPITALSNVLYSVHFYAATHTGWLRDRVKEAISAGVPVIVSESSGSEAAGTGANNYDEWQAWFDFMDQNGISWIDYSVSDKAGETISVLEPGAAATGGWDTTQLTETGRYIRDTLLGYCRE